MLVQIQPPDIVLSGLKLVTTAGTEVTISAGTCKSITIKALSTNTGFIYVGGPQVSSANGFQLQARESVSLDISNLGAVWIDSSVNGEGVCWIANN